MAALADIERLLERIFERSTARLFHTRVQAVQLERRLERVMDQSRHAVGGRTSVPSLYRVRLHPPDLADAAQRLGGADALAAHLANTALAYARAHAYHLAGPPSVALIADPSVPAGQVEIGAIAEPPRRAPPTGAPRPVAGPATSSIRGEETQTRVYRGPVPQAARAVLRLMPADGLERTVEVDGTPLSIGRGPDNGLVVPDARVSRHHGRLQARRGALVYTDLGSTNGSRVNGVRVDELVLGQGDRLEIGDTVLVVEMLPG